MIDREAGRSARSSPSSLDTLLHPQFDAEALAKAAKPDRQGPRPPARALPAARSSSPPRTPSSGQKRGEKVVLVRLETSPEDIDGHEGRPGHPHRPRRHDLPRGGRCPRHGHLLRLRLRRHRHGRGEQEVHPRRQDVTTKATSSPSTAPPARSTTAPSRPLTPPSPATSAASWAGPTSYRQPDVSAPTPTPRATPQQAREFGAEGIGLCRTEHMFFEADRIAALSAR